MNVYEVVLKYTHNRFSVIDYPPGWKPLIQLAQYASDRLDIPIQYLHIDKGLLRIVCAKTNSDTDGVLMEMACQAIAKLSSTTCLMLHDDRVVAYRKKLEPEYPCLCAPHYIEFVNLVDDHAREIEVPYVQ